MIVAAGAFTAALGAALVWGRPALRAIAVIAICLVPVRGGLLALANDLPFAVSDLAVNALVPALVAALVVGIAFRLRPDPATLPRVLAVGWLLIVLVALLNLLTFTVGIKVYAVGLAQYAVYPTLALSVCALLDRGDDVRLTWLLVGLGGLVSLTAVIQALGVESFIQSASAEVEGFSANRYAGITGSYLHTSSFVGTVSVLAMGALVGRGKPRELLLGAVLLALIFSGIVLTFSRSGIVIAGIGVLALAVFGTRSRRLRLAALVLPAVVAGLAVSSSVGTDPKETGERVVSLARGESDRGNKHRVEQIEKGLDAYRNAPVEEKILGRGLAATGNASKLVDESALIVESYYLKLLVELGAVGTLLIGGYLVAVFACFALLIWLSREPMGVALGAAGVGLSLYNLIYPALETQILAMTWWLLAALCTRRLFDLPGEPGYLGRPAGLRADAPREA